MWDWFLENDLDATGMVFIPLTVLLFVLAWLVRGKKRKWPVFLLGIPMGVFAWAFIIKMIFFPDFFLNQAAERQARPFQELSARYALLCRQALSECGITEWSEGTEVPEKLLAHRTIGGGKTAFFGFLPSSPCQKDPIFHCFLENWMVKEAQRLGVPIARSPSETEFLVAIIGQPNKPESRLPTEAPVMPLLLIHVPSGKLIASKTFKGEWATFDAGWAPPGPGKYYYINEYGIPTLYNPDRYKTYRQPIKWDTVIRYVYAAVNAYQKDDTASEGPTCP